MFRLFIIRVLEVMGQLLPENILGCRLRGMCYQPFLKRCGRNFQVGIGVKLEHTQRIEIGSNVYIGHGSWISGLRGGVVLEDEVMLGPYVTMVSSDHQFKAGSARYAESKASGIRIGRGSWLAAKVIGSNSEKG